MWYDKVEIESIHWPLRLSTQRINERIVRDPVYPRREAPRRVKILDVLIYGHEHVLHDIANIVVGGKKPMTVSEQLSCVSVHENRKCLVIPCLHQLCETFIRSITLHSL